MRTESPIRVTIGPATVFIYKVGERVKLAVDAPPEMHVQIEADKFAPAISDGLAKGE